MRERGGRAGSAGRTVVTAPIVAQVVTAPTVARRVTPPAAASVVTALIAALAAALVAPPRSSLATVTRRALASLGAVCALLLAGLMSAPGAAASESCGTSWTGEASDGNWYTAGNWDHGVPTSSMVACIEEGATYTVTIDGGTATASKLELGGTSGVAELKIEGNGTLELSDGGTTTANGKVLLTGVSWTNSTLTVQAGTLTNGGTIVAEPTAESGTRYLNGNIVNEGTIEVDSATQYDSSGTAGTLDNKGTIGIGASTCCGALTVPAKSGSTVINDAGGSITNNGGSGYLNVASGNTFVQKDGSTSPSTASPSSPAVRVQQGTIEYAGDGSAQASTIEGLSCDGEGNGQTLTGSLQASQSLLITTYTECVASENASASFTNAGTITLANGYYGATLNVPAGDTLTNAATGTIADDNSGSLNGSIVNEGTIEVNSTEVSDSTEGARIENKGTISLAYTTWQGPYLTVTAKSGSTVINDAGGSITNNGGSAYLNVASGNTFVQKDGATSPSTASPSSPAVIVHEGTLEYAGDGSAKPSTIYSESCTGEGKGQTLSGEIGPSQSLVIDSDGECEGDVSTAGSFTNAGTITMTGYYGAFLNIPSADTLTNSQTGLIDVTAGNGNGGLNGSIVNEGTIESNGVSDKTAGSTIDNKGTISLAHTTWRGPYFTVSGSNSTVINDAGGSITNNEGSAYMNVGGGSTFVQKDGSTSPASLEAGAPVVVLHEGTLEYAADAAAKESAIESESCEGGGNTQTLSGNLEESQQLLIGSDGECEADEIASASFTNNGTIEMTGYYGAYLNVPSGKTLTNSPTGTVDVTAGNGNGALNGNLTNEGTIETTGVSDKTSGSTIDNKGTISLAASACCSAFKVSGTGTTVINDARGSITNNEGSAYMEVSAGNTFEQNDGAISPSGATPAHPAVIVHEGTLKYTGDGSAKPGTIEGLSCEGEGSAQTLSGTVQSGESLVLSSDGECVTTANAAVGFTNDGTITLSNGYYGQTLNMASGGTLTNSSTGKITVNPGGNFRSLNGSIANAGAIVIEAPTTFGGSGATLANSGSISIAKAVGGAGLAASANEGITVVNEGSGTITNNEGSGYVNVPSGTTFVQKDGGTEPSAADTSSPAVAVHGGTLEYAGDGSAQPSTIEAASCESSGSGGTLSGDIASTQSLLVNSDGGCAVMEEASASFANAGTITLKTASGNDASLKVPSGEKLTNRGSIDAVPGAGGTGRLEGGVTSTGTVSVASGATLTTTSFTAQGGKIAAAGTFASTEELVEQGARTTEGPVEVRSGKLIFEGTGHADFLVPAGGDPSISGDIAADQTLTIDDTNGVCGGTVVNATGPFTNAGTIEFTAANTCESSSAELTSGNATITNVGTIAFDATSTGAGEIDGPIDNTASGTISVDHGGVAIVKGSLSSAGTVSVGWGKLSLSGGLANLDEATSTLTGGTYRVLGGNEEPATLEVGGGEVKTLDASLEIGSNASFTGSVPNIAKIGEEGALTLDAGVEETAGAVENAGSLTLDAGAKLSVGEYTQDSTGSLAVGVAGAPGTSGALGALSASGKASLAGTLAIAQAPAFTPSSGDSYTPIEAEEVTGTFSDVTGAAAGGMLAYGVSYEPSSVTLSVEPGVDLAASGVSGPSSATIGESVTVGWTVSAEGKEVPGSWTDAVYLSPNGTIGPRSVLLGTAKHEGGLSAGGKYSGSLTADVPGVLPGSWRIVVLADANSGVADVDSSNNTASSGAVTIATSTLAVGGTLSGTTPANGDSYVEIEPTSGSNLKLTATFDEGATSAMYVAFGRLPSPSDHDAAPTDSSAATQSLTIADTQSGTYFVDIDNPTSSPQQYKLEASNPALSIASVTPRSAAFVYDSTPGSCGGGTCTQPAPTQPELSSTIRGTDFSPQSTAELECTGLDATTAGGTEHSYAARSLTYAGSKQLYADFGPVPSPTGSCTVSVKDGASTTSLADAMSFEKATQNGSGAEEAPSEAPHVSVIAPSVNRPGVDSEVVVDYSNPYRYPIPAPLMELEASGATLHYPEVSAGDSSSLPLLGASPTGDPGVLTPGQSGSIEVIFDSTVAIHKEVSFTVKTLASPQEDAKFGEMLAGQLPSSTEPAVISYVKEHAPKVTYGQLQSLLDADARYLASIGEPDTNAEDLLAYELNKVTNYGVLLANHTDGPFGLGMPGVVDSLSVDSSGNVTLLEPRGGAIVFAALPDGEYEAPSGVALTLTGEVGSGWVLEQPNEGSAQFDAAGQLTKASDGNGNAVTYSYTGSELTGISAPNGDHSTLTYDGSGHVTSIEDSRTGRTATFAYDGSGRLTEESAAGRTLKLSWNAQGGNAALDGTLASVTAPGGAETDYSYDGEGRLTAVTHPDGTKLESLSYPSPGTVQVTDGNGNLRTESLDASGRVVRTVLPDGTLRTTSLNDLGEPSEVTLAGASERFGYDAAGALTSLTDPAGKRTTLSYSAPGMPTRITRPDGLTTTIARDSQQQATSVTDPAGNSTSFAYTAAGLPASITDRNGQTTHASYDSAEDLTAVTTPAGGNVALSYDSAHQLVSASDANGTTTYGYDANGRVSSVTYPTGLGISFTYDSSGRRASETTSDGYTLDYHYDGNGQLTSVSSGGKTLVQYTYDANGRLVSAVNGNGTKTTYAYDSRGRIASVVNEDASGKVSSSYTYARDDAGRVTAIEGPSGSSTYTYDAAGELTGATLAGGRQLSWSFDAAGNRTSASDSAGTSRNYSLGADDEYLSDGSTTYTYDKNGQLTSSQDAAGKTIYTWTPQGRLASASGPNGKVSYTYDALGDLVSEESGGKTTDLLPDPITGTPVGTYSSAGAPIAHYPVGDGVIGQAEPSGSTSYFGFDGSGDVVSLSGPAGGIAGSFEYLPFGQLASHSGSDSTPFGFGGRFGITTDPVTGLTTNGSREYDPVTGRFVSQDSALLGAPNPYEYANNDPLDQTDLTGNNAVEDDLGAAENGMEAAQGVAGFNSLAAGAVGDGSKAAIFGRISEGAGKAADVLEAVNLGVDAGKFLDKPNATTGTAALRAGVNAVAQGLAGEVSGPLAPVVVPAVGLALPGMEEAAANEMTEGLAPVFAKPEAKRTPAEEAALHDPCFNRPIPPGCGKWPLGPGLKPAAGGTSGTRGSHDPNEMIGPSGYSEAGYLPAGTTLPYEVEFSNTASAALPAATVTVTEPLSDNVDLSTFSLGSFGFGHHVVSPPQGLRSYQATIDDTAVSGLDVKVKARLDAVTRTVKWTFTSIDPATGLPPSDPEAGFLAPDKSPPEGEGFVSYTVSPPASAPSGTAIAANATVQFDANDTMTTNEVKNRIDGSAPNASVESLPSTETGPFTLSWSGSDGSEGSGIATYDVDVSEDGGPFKPLETDTTSTSTTFTGDVGHSYAFIAWARDNVGNVEAEPMNAQAQTTVQAPSTTTTTSSSATETSGTTTTSTTTATTTTSTTSTTSTPPPPKPGEAKASAHGSVKGATAMVTLSCTGEGPCKGVLKLEVKLTTKHMVKRHGKRHVVKRTNTVAIGHASFAIVFGGSETVQVDLSGKGRALLRKAGKRGLQVQVAGDGVAAGTVRLEPAGKGGPGRKGKGGPGRKGKGGPGGKRKGG